MDQAICAAFMSPHPEYSELASNLFRKAELEEEAAHIDAALDLAEKAFGPFSGRTSCWRACIACAIPW